MIRIVAVIPLYNHRATIRDVVRRTLRVLPDVIVVDDGSDDGGSASLSGLPVRILRFTHNRGKGSALLAGAEAARAGNFTHMITLDADGQHYPEDIPLFISAIKSNPQSFIVGKRTFTTANIPAASRFGRRFSSFWMFVQTGVYVDDMQSGFRAYPLAPLSCLDLHEKAYSFEIEVLVKAAWAGFSILERSVRVFYPPAALRVSHFRVVLDNWRITLLNTRLTIRALLPVPFRRHALDAEGKLSLCSPARSLRLLLREATPRHLAFSAGVAMFVGTLPLLGLQSIILLACIHGLRLNRLCALLVIPLTWFPLLPALSIAAGHSMLHGSFPTDVSWQTLGRNATLLLGEWIIGSLVLAPITGCLVAGATLLAGIVISRRKRP